MAAHQQAAPPELVQAARQTFLGRYTGVCRLYLRRLLRDSPNREEAVEDCYQDFSLKFIEGKFKGADPERGRFRDYLKTSLRNLALNYHRRQQGQPPPWTGLTLPSRIIRPPSPTRLSPPSGANS
jgi:RNA polymerase sigma-70 factor (ECF subfamily)